MPDQEWIQQSSARVVAKYAPPTVQSSAWHLNHDSEYAFDGDVPSSSYAKTRRTYHVTVKWDGTGTCTCDGFGYRHTCSHIDAVKKVLNER